MERWAKLTSLRRGQMGTWTYVHGGLFRPMTRAAMVAQDMSSSIKIETLNRTSAVFQFLLDDAFTKYRAIASDPSL